VLLEFHAHQQPAIAAAANAEMGGGGDAPVDDILCNGGKIIIDDLPFGFQPGLVPGRPKFGLMRSSA